MATAPVGRRKGSAIRAWLTVSDSGGSELREVGKHAIMRRTGLPARDLRVLDPMLSYPSTILGRERAIVVNLDHIKAIVTATEVLLPNSRDPVVAPFVHDLRSRVGPPTSVAEEHHDLMIQNVREGSSSLPITSSPKDGGAKLLPFEFRALEVCLESACKSLESETLTLETEAYPAMDELTSKISTLNLERVRQIKSRLVAVSGRVQKVRDELEHLLDDDMDMAEMYLTQKLVNQPIGGTSLKVESDDDVFITEEEREDQFENDSERSIRTSNAFKPNIEELEMLLEAYFVQIDGILNKLSTLKEYVDDTEDYINIMLDEKQNQLLQMGVMLSTATLVFNAGIAVVGLFGMNITIDLFKDTADPSNFWKIAFCTVGACVLMFVIAIGWGKKSGLLRL